MGLATTDDRRLANRNAAALWTALAEAHALTRRPGFLAVHGSERTGLRILLLDPDPTPDERAELTELVRGGRADRLTVEDPYGVLDLAPLGLTAGSLPVMIRPPAPVPAPALPVTPVERSDQLAVAQDVVVHGFPLHDLLRHPEEAFPAALLDRPEARFFVVHSDGVPAGACLTVRDDRTVGLYWMTTLPEHRSRGVGRALLHGVLSRLGDVPMTLTAARAGRPLYDSLGFVPVGDARWWG